MSIHAQALSGGFAQPVFDAQSVFRLLMDGMSRPGTIQNMSIEIDQPPPLGRAAAAVALTLCDGDTTFWLHADFRKTPVAEWISFHTGASLSAEKAQATFAFMRASAGICSFDLFASVTQEYPDRSATIVIEVAAIGEGRPLTLSGPGIRDQVTIQVDGLPELFDDVWQANRALFPRGVDVILSAGQHLLCLPRTTNIA
ncbi:MAG TPA: phosphonate C-P lyase system protein PhnH [Pseudorhizobium sp.]|nr:phosphonate C-P lyase system protein PhnH [Pseudorhizobium sp.]